MTLPRQPVQTVTFIDDYCQFYQKLFVEVRQFEYFKFTHLGLLSEVKRKTLPSIAKAVGLPNAQGLHHFLSAAPWSVSALRALRLQRIKDLVDEPFALCLDETGDRKKGSTTDYVSTQYIGNLGKTDNGIVSVNAYGVIDSVTFPLLFRVFKPKSRLKEGEVHISKVEMAAQMIEELLDDGFKINLILADRLYGESARIRQVCSKHNIPYIMAIRSNYSVRLPKNEYVRRNRWHECVRTFTNGSQEVRYIREVVFGKRRPNKPRVYEITTEPETMPKASTAYIKTNIQENIWDCAADLYGLRTWIEYGFKEAKNELGWNQFRLTNYDGIERWWEFVFSAFWLICEQSLARRGQANKEQARQLELLQQHKHFREEIRWKPTLDNLRLLMQPFFTLWVLLPWLELFPIPSLVKGLYKLVRATNQFSGFT